MHQFWNRPLRTAAGALIALGIIVPGALTASAHQAVKSHAARPTGTIVFSDNQFPDTLNPFEEGLAVDIEQSDMTLPSGAGPYYGPTGHLLPGFLTKVPSLKNGGISKNGKTITVFLRKGLKWSNGQPITSKDIKFAWALGMNTNLGTCSGTCDHIKSIALPNKYEAIFHMKDVYAPAIPNAFPGFMPSGWSKLSYTSLTPTGVEAAAKTLSDVNFTYEDSSYVTAGPYKVSQFVTNNRITFVPNMKYNAIGGPPHLARAIFLFYSSVDTEIAGAVKHETDITTDYTLSQLPQLLAHKKQFTTQEVSTLSPEHLEYNTYNKTVNGQPNPLTNLKVRQAVNLAIDRFGIQKSVFGVGNKKSAANLFTYDGPWVVTPTIKQLYADPAITGAWDPIAKKFVPYGSQSVKDAKKLLAGTPCASGCTIQISSTTLPQRAAEAAVVTSNLAKIGITGTFTAIPASQFFTTYDKGGTLNTGKFELGLFAYVGVVPDPDGWKYTDEGKYNPQTDPTHNPTVDKNYSGLNDKIVNQDFEKAAATLNSSQRKKYYYQAQIELAKQAVWTDLSIRPGFCTVDSKVSGESANGFSNDFCGWQPNAWKFR